MAIAERFCVNHPDRAAIGICVITRKAICGECSTRYEGVNYSREGLKILQDRRAATSVRPRRGWLTIGASVCAAPVMLYLMYLAFMLTANLTMNFIFRGR